MILTTSMVRMLSLSCSINLRSLRSSKVFSSYRSQEKSWHYLATISSQVQELRSTGDKLQEVLQEKESELQQALADLRKLQATKEREEYKSTQESSAIQ